MPRKPLRDKSMKQSTPVKYTPPQTQVQKSSFGSSMKDGFGLGMGSAIAHTVVNRFMTPNSPTRNEQCAGYEECLKVVGVKEQCDKIFKQCSQVQ